MQNPSPSSRFSILTPRTETQFWCTQSIFFSTQHPSFKQFKTVWPNKHRNRRKSVVDKPADVVSPALPLGRSFDDGGADDGASTVKSMPAEDAVSNCSLWEAWAKQKTWWRCSKEQWAVSINDYFRYINWYKLQVPSLFSGLQIRAISGRCPKMIGRAKHPRMSLQLGSTKTVGNVVWKVWNLLLASEVVQNVSNIQQHFKPLWRANVQRSVLWGFLECNLLELEAKP